MNTRRQSGFTLIEMVAVIIILAIMAATALPKFINLSGDARLSSINGLAGGLRSAAALAKSQWMAAQSGAQTYVSMGATVVTVFNATSPGSTPDVMGYPTADALGIIKALDDTSGYESGISPTISYAWRFFPTGVTSSNCYAEYYSGTVTVSATALTCI